MYKCPIILTLEFPSVVVIFGARHLKIKIGNI